MPSKRRTSALRSMTGYGAATSELDGMVVGAELRSVNHRHLNLKMRLPSEFAAFEGDLDSLLRKRLERGSVMLSMSWTGRAGARPASIDFELLERYRTDLEAARKRLGVGEGVSMDTLLQLPGVLSVPDEEKPDTKRLRRSALSVVDEALERLIEMRTTEGEAIRHDLESHAAATRKVVGKIERRMPTVVRTHQKALEKRVGELLGGAGHLQPGDIAREIALLADRLDVSEELARLASHLDQLSTFLSRGGRLGRKLDFLVQEIFREVNTIGAKCSDTKVSHWVVEAKTHVERLREQVQNVE
ncbi:MAG TPA: YicC family protein [Planctomycetes bacterium]|nr:YicC family protein [Planctomycetota bacterium]